MAITLSDEQDLLFSELIDLLRQSGFHIGEEHYVRLYALLDRYPFDRASENIQQELKTVLCPIFATSKEQQDTFNRLFDQHYPFRKQEIPPINVWPILPPDTEDKEKPPSKWPYILGAFIVIALISWFVGWIFPSIFTEPHVTETTPDLPSPLTAQTSGPIPPAPPEENAPEVAPSFWDTLSSILKSLLVHYLLPFTMMLATLVAMLFYTRYHVRHREWTLERHRAQKPPFSCSITVPDRPSELFEAEHSFHLTRQLRRRLTGDQYTIDIPGTIAATIQSAGFPRLLFKPGTQLPEYLILIDRATSRDHQAQAYADLVKTLDWQGLYVTRYFFDGDPRICWGDTRQTHYPLAEIQEKHGRCRLVIIGDGDRLWDLLTGSLEPWVDMLTLWADRAILTPALPEQCGPRELTLASQFVLLPATSGGLLALAEHFEVAGTAALKSWVQPYGKQPDYREDIGSGEATNGYVLQLEDYLGQELFQWVCACAVYPELHWDLTLALGLLPEVGYNLLTEDNLLRLIRLPWFRNGEIPDKFRWLLIQKLRPDSAAAVSRTLIGILMTITPTEGTFAADNHRVNLTMQAWMLSRNRKTHAALNTALSLLPYEHVKQDQTMLRLLEAGSQLGLASPFTQFKKLLFPYGLSSFGLRTSVFIVSLLAGALLAVPPVKDFMTAGGKNVCAYIITSCTGHGEIVTVDLQALLSSDKLATRRISDTTVSVSDFEDGRAENTYLGVRNHWGGGESYFTVPEGKLGETVTLVVADYLQKRGWLVGSPKGGTDVIITGEVSDLSVNAMGSFGSTDIEASVKITIRALNRRDRSSIVRHVASIAKQTIILFEPKDAQNLLNQTLSDALERFVTDTRFETNHLRVKDGQQVQGAAPSASELRDVFFARDSYGLDAVAKTIIEWNADIFKSNPDWKIILEGHTDERSTPSYSLVLGEKRAKTVRNYLIELGISANRLGTVAYGKERPFCKEHTERCYQMNHRVHFVVRDAGNTRTQGPNTRAGQKAIPNTKQGGRQPTSPNEAASAHPPSASPVIKEIAFRGNTTFKSAALEVESKLKAGELLDQFTLKSEVQRLTDFYSERGYAFVDVTPNILTDNAARTAVVTWNIREGDLIRVRKINISGNDQTPDKIIRSRIVPSETELLNTKALKESFHRLEALGLFETVEILPQQVDANAVDLEVRVKEKPRGKDSSRIDLGIEELQITPQKDADTKTMEGAFDRRSNDTIPPNTPTNPRIGPRDSQDSIQGQPPIEILKPQESLESPAKPSQQQTEPDSLPQQPPQKDGLPPTPPFRLRIQ